MYDGANRHVMNIMHSFYKSLVVLPFPFQLQYVLALTLSISQICTARDLAHGPSIVWNPIE